MAVPQRSPQPPSTPRSLRKRLKSFLSASKRKRQWTNESAGPAEVVAALAAHLPNFLQLGKVTLRLHISPWTDSLSDLLCSVWAQRGQFIHTLHIEATLPHLDDFLETCSTVLPHLESLSLELLSSRISHPPPNFTTLCSKIIAFIKSHEDTLETLILHELPYFDAFVDLSTLIRDLGFLPRLKRLMIPIKLPPWLLPQHEYIRGFLTLHVPTLEHLDFCFRHTNSFILDAFRTLTFKQLINNVLPTLELPVLQELSLDVYMNEQLRQPFCLPPFTTFAPNIKTLILRGSLDFTAFKMLLQNLSNVDLRSLYLQVDYLCPEHFDLLGSQLPTLESLELIYTELAFMHGAQIQIYPAGSHSEFNFGARFDDRRYINWALKYLRLSHKSSCSAGHLRRNRNAMVATSIPGLEVNDVEMCCGCPS